MQRLDERRDARDVRRRHRRAAQSCVSAVWHRGDDRDTGRHHIGFDRPILDVRTSGRERGDPVIVVGGANGDRRSRATGAADRVKRAAVSRGDTIDHAESRAAIDRRRRRVIRIADSAET